MDERKLDLLEMKELIEFEVKRTEKVIKELERSVKWVLEMLDRKIKGE